MTDHLDPARVDDAEVERLYRARLNVYYNERDRGSDVARAESAGVRAVLADLATRWHLVPREGAQEREEWNARMRNGGRFWIGPELVDEAQARDVVGRSEGAMTLVRRTVTTVTTPDGAVWTRTGPWEPADTTGGEGA